MRFTYWLGLALAANAALSTPSHAKTIPLAPKTPWNIHYDDDSCVLRRAFGTEAQQIQINLRKFAPQARVQVAAFGKGVSGLPRVSAYRFSLEEKWRDIENPVRANFNEDMQGTFFDMTIVEDERASRDEMPLPEMRQFAAVNLEAADKVSAIHLRVGSNEVILNAGPLKKPILAIDGCIDDLIGRWGLDPKVQTTLQNGPVPVNLKAVARMMDYPPKMVMKEMPGLVNVRLGVDETGKVTGCHIQLEVSDPAFEEFACGDLQTSMDFEPALDAEGRPVASYWTTTVRYRLTG